MALNDLKPLSNMVKQSNALVRAKNNIPTPTAGRLLACLIAQVDDKDVDFKEEYSIPVSMVFDETAKRGGSNKLGIRKAVGALSASKVWLESDDDSGNYASVPYFMIVEKRGSCIRARFNPLMKPLLLELKDYFTQFSLTEYLSIQGLHSQKIYQMLKSWEHGYNKQFIDISLSALREYLQLEKKYPNFKDFRVKVLEQAEKDINNGKTSINFSWEPIKTGNAVTSIRFSIKSVKTERVKLEQKEKRQQKKIEEQDLARMCAYEKRGECDRTNCSSWKDCNTKFLAEARQRRQNERSTINEHDKLSFFNSLPLLNNK